MVARHQPERKIGSHSSKARGEWLEDKRENPEMIENLHPRKKMKNDESKEVQSRTRIYKPIYSG